MGKAKRAHRAERDALLAARELSLMLAHNGPYRGDWCADCLRRRSELLAILGHPLTFILDGADPVSGLMVRIGDAANLLDGGSPAASCASPFDSFVH